MTEVHRHKPWLRAKNSKAGHILNIRWLLFAVNVQILDTGRCCCFSSFKSDPHHILQLFKGTLVMVKGVRLSHPQVHRAQPTIDVKAIHHSHLVESKHSQMLLRPFHTTNYKNESETRINNNSCISKSRYYSSM